MKRKTSLRINALLLFTMIVSVFAPLSALAAAVQLQINNLYTVPLFQDDGTTPRADAITSDLDGKVFRLTTSPISLSVTFSGIADDKINDVYYETTNMNTGVTSVNKTNKAAKNPSNNNEIIFSDVVLTEGLNRVIVKYGDTSVVASRGGWAYFTPVSNITDLKLNNVPFVNDEMYPKEPPYQGLSITGTANNANQVQAYTGGTAYNPAVLNRGAFTFITNTGRGNDLAFKPGDNELQFTSLNYTNSYNIDRTFVYDNGRAFGYEVKARRAGTADAYKKLVSVPTLIKSSSDAIELQANLKSPVDANNDLVHDFIDIYIRNTSYKIRYDLNTGDFSSTGTGNGVSPLVPASFTEKTTLSQTGKYKVLDFKFDLPTANAKYQEVVFEFGTAADGILDTSVYSFNVLDPSIPYVDHMNYLTGDEGTAIKLNEVGATQLSQFPAKFHVYTTNNADEVQLEINGSVHSTVPAVVNPVVADGGFYKDNGVNLVDNNGTAMKRAEISIDSLPDGFATLRVTPLVGGNAQELGVKSFVVSISSAPYVILNHVYSGQVFSSSKEIGCGSGTAAPCLTGRFVNLPSSEYGNVVFQVNDKQFAIATIDPATGIFTIEPTLMDTLNKTSFNTEMSSDGKKAIKFSLKIGGKVITESTFDLFVLNDRVPYINSLNPIEANPDDKQFKSVAVDEYATTEDQIAFKGVVRNSSRQDNKTEYYIQYTIPGETEKKTVVINQPSTAYDSSANYEGNFTETFTTAVISMPVTGDYYFQMTATNKSGVIASKTVKISKEAHPYVIESPTNIFVNEDGLTQANINKNFEKIVIRADGAVSILFGKEEVTPKDGKFEYEAKSLKPGKNEIKFTVNRGTAQISASLILFNVNTPIEGAQYKSEMASTMKVFNGDLELKFPKDTKFMRNDRTGSGNYLTTNRELLFGIANINTGVVDKKLDVMNGTQYLNGSVSTYRFKPASKLYWIDAGVIRNLDSSSADYEVEMKDALEGSGTLPLLANVAGLSSNLQPVPFFSRDIRDLVVPTQSVTMTFKYDQSITSDAWKYVSVFQYNQFEDLSGGGYPEQGWRNIGGIVDQKKNTITVTVPSFGYFQVMYMNDSFNDVTNHSWARDILDTLYSKGLMLNKDPGGRFLPDDAITRGEFVTLLVKIFDIPLNNVDTNDTSFLGTFGDVRKGNFIQNSNGLYDYMHIEAGARAGIVRGTSQGLFLPNEAIMRQDAALMIARAAELKLSSDDDKTQATLDKLFTDSTDPKFNYYSKSAVEAVAKAGFIEGRPNTLLAGQTKETLRFDPADNITRAEASAIALRVLKKLNKVPK